MVVLAWLIGSGEFVAWVLDASVLGPGPCLRLDISVVSAATTLRIPAATHILGWYHSWRSTLTRTAQQLASQRRSHPRPGLFAQLVPLPLLPMSGAVTPPTLCTAGGSTG